MDKSLRFSGDKETELQVSFGNCRVSANMYATQLKKIDSRCPDFNPGVLDPKQC